MAKRGGDGTNPPHIWVATLVLVLVLVLLMMELILLQNMQVTGTEVLGGGRRGESITTEVTIIVEVIRIVVNL